MTEADEPARRRKPLRRTAWSLFIGGLVVTGLMFGAGLLLLAGGEDIGPGQPVVWAAGERASVHKQPGPPNAESSKCEVIGSDGEPRSRSAANKTRSSPAPRRRSHRRSKAR